MLFNSFEFVAFFVVFLVVYFSLPSRTQPLVMLVGSYVFYMGWRPSFALLLAFTTIVDYLSALVMSRARSEAMRRIALIAALTINLGILGTVKYLDFMIANALGLMGIFGYPMPDYVIGFVLPVGISFYTFQSVSYTLDVYNRRIEAETDFVTYAQFVSFFPQLVAGPIERAGNMLSQFKTSKALLWDNVPSGLWLVGYGLFKKMCIADAIAPIVKATFQAPQDFSGSYHVLASLLFIVQVYCDFSGYSDVARGVARIMGFELMINFRQPFYATSLADFWRRWHISLSTWFRDYVFYPLGGSRGGEGRSARNLLIVFVASGIWHGAAWTYVIWSAFHGVCLVIERLFVRLARPETWPLQRLLAVIGGVWAVSIFAISMIFFRASSVSNALDVLTSFGDIGKISLDSFKAIGVGNPELAMLATSLILLFVIDYQICYRPDRLAALERRFWVPTLGGVALAYYIVLFGVFGRVEFIYFQF